MRPTRRTAPTSLDVAREAGVAQSTVSYVLTGRRSISPRTRQRVLDAMDRLSYRPNAGARALAGQRMHVLGAVLPFRAGQNLAASMELVGGLAAAARRHDHDILLASADEGPEGVARLRGTGICDGLFILEVVEDDPRLDQILDSDAAAVVIGRPADTRNLICVDLDFEAAGARAVGELAGLGHRTGLMITPALTDPAGSLTYLQRFIAGTRSRAAQHGMQLLHRELSGSRDQMVTAVRSAMAEHGPVTAVVMLHDVSMIMTVLEQAGLVPGADTAVVAICRDEQAERQAVRLSSIPLEPAAVADRAVELMIDQLDGRAVSPGVHLVPPRLIRRETSVRT